MKCTEKLAIVARHLPQCRSDIVHLDTTGVTSMKRNKHTQEAKHTVLLAASLRELAL